MPAAVEHEVTDVTPGVQLHAPPGTAQRMPVDGNHRGGRQTSSPNPESALPSISIPHIGSDGIPFTGDARLKMSAVLLVKEHLLGGVSDLANCDAWAAFVKGWLRVSVVVAGHE